MDSLLLSSIIEDIILARKEFADNLRWDLVKFYHTIGELLSHRDNLDYADLSTATGISARNLYRARQLHVKYPELDLLPEGKNTSWHMVCNKYLPVPRQMKELVEIQQEECEHQSISICSICKIRL